MPQRQFFYNSESIEKMLSNKVEFTQQQIDNNSEKIKSIFPAKKVGKDSNETTTTEEIKK